MPEAPPEVIPLALYKSSATLPHMNCRSLAFVAMTICFAGCLPKSWIEFRSPDGSFSVLFPGPVNRQKLQKRETVIGVKDQHIWGYEGKGIAYLVSYTDLPASYQGKTPAPDDLLDGLTKGVVEGVQGQLLGETTISLGQHPGRDLKIAINSPTPGITGRFRNYMVKHRSYQLSVLRSTAELSEKDVSKFFNSFKLLESPAN